MVTRPTKEQTARLHEAQERERAEDDGILSLVATAFTNWIMSVLKPIVGRAVRSIVDWIAKLFS